VLFAILSVKLLLALTPFSKAGRLSLIQKHGLWLSWHCYCRMDKLQSIEA